ncbi:hypothetical protein MANES_01G238151v8 [Manihot esculenta]|uniref:Uncharacterized protein n=1 Tax=Manihot esculenta TaxID=3983 RepID=A0ACB7IHF6_MANES|nr:hypothetical protein MANES_01G238151v8 [Manihot esculenta]
MRSLEERESNTMVAPASPTGRNITEEDSQLLAYMESFNGINERDYSLNSALQWPTYYSYH